MARFSFSALWSARTTYLLASLTLGVLTGCGNGTVDPPTNTCGDAAGKTCCTFGGTLPMGVTVNSDGCISGLMCDNTSQTCQTVSMPTCGAEGAVCCSTGAPCQESDNTCEAGRCVAPTGPMTTLRTLRVSRTTGGTITFTSSTCPASYSTCQGEFPDGQLIRIDASASEGYRLQAWLNAPATCDAASNRCSVNMTQDYDIRVVFEEIPDVTTPSDRQLRLNRTGAGSVRTTDGNCTVSDDSTCMHDYADGTEITLEATPDAGNQLRFWGVTGCETSSSTCTLTMDRNRTIEVAFEATAATEYRLNVTRDDGGTFDVLNQSCPGRTCSPLYTSGETAVIIASPSEGYRVSTWTVTPADGVSCADGATRCEVPMDRARDVNVGFEVGTPTTPQRTLTITRTSGGYFFVEERDCPGATCSPTYSDGATATINAYPDAAGGFRVERWEGAEDCGTATTCNVLMDADKTVNIVFTDVPSDTEHTLNVDRTSGGTFSVAGPYFCLFAPCSYTVPHGDEMIITASPSSGYTVARWEGAEECGTSTTCMFTMNAPRDINIVFEAEAAATYTLDVSRSEGGTFQVTGESCPGSSCSLDLASGSMAEIVASPNAGFSINSWEGAPECGTNTTCSVTMDRNRSVRVIFQDDSGGATRTLFVSRSDNGTFQVTGESCPGSTCTLTYTNGDTAQIVASPASGYEVARWEGVSGCSGNTCDITMNASYNVNIVFEMIGAVEPEYSLNVVSALVPDVDGNGSNWDSFGGAQADPYIVVEFQTFSGSVAATARTTTQDNVSGEVTWNESIHTGLTPTFMDDHDLVIRVWDDESFDELMCEGSFLGFPSELTDGAVHSITCGRTTASQTVSMPVRIQFIEE